jgi:hypothetical protein
MRVYRSDSTREYVVWSVLLLSVGTLFSWIEMKDTARLVEAWLIGLPFFSAFVLIDYFFTYIKIDETSGTVAQQSFLYWYKKIPISSIIKISKQPHPLYKALSWSIAVEYRREKGKNKVMEIWPSFSPETIGKFLTDMKSLDPSIQFDKECEEWMEKAQKAKA